MAKKKKADNRWKIIAAVLAGLGAMMTGLGAMLTGLADLLR